MTHDDRDLNVLKHAAFPAAHTGRDQRIGDAMRKALFHRGLRRRGWRAMAVPAAALAGLMAFVALIGAVRWPGRSGIALSQIFREPADATLRGHSLLRDSYSTTPDDPKKTQSKLSAVGEFNVNSNVAIDQIIDETSRTRFLSERVGGADLFFRPASEPWPVWISKSDAASTDAANLERMATDARNVDKEKSAALTASLGNSGLLFGCPVNSDLYAAPEILNKSRLFRIDAQTAREVVGDNPLELSVSKNGEEKSDVASRDAANLKRRLTIPLEVMLAGAPGLKDARSKSFVDFKKQMERIETTPRNSKELSFNSDNQFKTILDSSDVAKKELKQSEPSLSKTKTATAQLADLTEYQRLRRKAILAMELANRVSNADPLKAILHLRTVLREVRESAIDKNSVAPLEAALNNRIRDYNVKLRQSDVEKLEADRTKLVVDRRRREDPVKAQSQRPVRELSNRFHELMGRGKHAEAEAVAMQVMEIDPKEVFGPAAYELASTMKKLDLEMAPEVRNKIGWWTKLQQVEESSIPVPDEPPLFYLAPKAWEELSVRRIKYAPLSLRDRVEAKNKISAALKQPTTADFTETPLSTAIQYFSTFHGIDVYIDDGGLADARVDKEILINFMSQGLSLENTLKLILEPLKLKAVIRNEVLHITSTADAGTNDAKPLVVLNRGKPTPAKPRTVTWKPSPLAANALRLAVGDDATLPLKAVQASVRIEGVRARVVLDCLFVNDHDRQLEGNFQLRLPDEASPFLLAFGTTEFTSQMPALPLAAPLGARFDREHILADRSGGWSNVREARVVPRDQAAHAYTETVHRRVDPALMEWAGAGVFNARVFPLAAKTAHRIVVGYDVDLTAVGEDREFKLVLPAGSEQRSASIEIADLPGVGTTVSPASKPLVDDGTTRFKFADPQADALVVRLAKPGPVLLKGKDAKTGAYFAAAFRPELPAAARLVGSDSAVFLLDVSLSSNPERFALWLKLMQQILDANRPSLKRFAVLCFNVEDFWWKPGFSDNTPANVAELMTFANGLALEGATDLGSAFAEASRPAWGKTEKKDWDVFLLSDGTATWGETEPAALAAILRSGRPGALFAYRTGMEGTDGRMLDHLAHATGGMVGNVLNANEIPAAAIAHRARPWRIHGVEIEGGSDLLLAGRPQTVFPNQNLLLVGRGAPAAGAEVVLRLKRDGEERVVRTKLRGPIPSELAPRLYGQAAVGQMEQLAAEGDDVVRAYARHFRVTGRSCSLLMLESEADYARYNIKPEEDELIVKMRPAAALIAKLLESTQRLIADRKAAFLAWVAGLENTPNISFKPSTAFRLALESLPENVFDLRPPPLVCKEHGRDVLPASWRDPKGSPRLDYAAVSSEAERRRGLLGGSDYLKALSSLIELQPGDPLLLRDFALSAEQVALPAQAASLWWKAVRLRPTEAPAYWRLANALADAGKSELALAAYEIAVNAVDARSRDFRRIVGVDYLRFLSKTSGAWNGPLAEWAAARRAALLKEFDLGRADVVVTLSWTTDATDVDLHVVEPSGEECFFSHLTTKQGGRLTQDVTTGFGPEMYQLTKAMPGEYKIKAHYYRSDANRLGVRTKVQVRVIEDLGASRERESKYTVVLVDGQDQQAITTIKRR